MCLVVFGLTVRVAGTGNVKPFDHQGWESSYSAAYSQKDPALVGEHISKLYNVAGSSRDDLIKGLAGEFKKYDKISFQYKVLEVKPSEMADRTVVKAGLSLKAIPVGATDYVTVSEGESFDSLVFEDGRWKLYDTVSLQGSLAASNRFGCPAGGTEAFNFQTEQGDWPAWRATEKGALTAQQAPPKGGKRFDAKQWEALVKSAWDSKDARRVGSLYSPLYNHLGLSKSAVLVQTDGLFKEYKTIKTNYRVIDFRYLSDPNLVSIKAIIEMTGVPNSGQTTTILATKGYASLRNEGGQWRIYATQIFH
jgi:hypothetical protein